MSLSVTNSDMVLERLGNGIFEDSLLFDLCTQAEYLSLVRDFDYLYSMLASKAILLPHQVFVVYTATNDMRGRALLADEVGLGKTIEAGMILKEMTCRGLVDKVLVLVPASLTTQWRDELREKFDEHFVIYNRKKREELEREGENIWAKNKKIICSIDTAKYEDQKERIKQIDWDLLIVDESHKVKNSETLRHKLVKEIPNRYLLFLTATPLQNNLMELYNQVYLLDEKLFGSPDAFKMVFVGDRKGLRPSKAEELRRRLQKIMLRTKRKEVVGITFTTRQGESILLDLSPEEMILYEAVTRYVKQAYSPRNAFVLMIYQRMTCSSSFAIRDALERRINKLERELRGESISGLSILEDEVDLEYEDIEDYEEEPKSPGQIQKELETLQEIHQLAKNIRVNTKGEKLKKLLREVNLKESGEKLLIFTEFRSTQKYLYDLLTEEGYDVAVFNGSLSQLEKDEAVRDFRENRQIMISTEAGGEGRNLQFCHLMVNYDLPWNPMRVDQRIGRVHRIGQERDVKVFNFSSMDTIEEYVLDLLQNKIRLFEEVVGELDLILGEISDNFELAIMKFLAESETKEQLRKSIEELGGKIEKAREQFKLLEDLDERAFGGFDISVYKEIMNKAVDPIKEQNKVASFFVKYLKKKGLKFFFETPEILRFEAFGGYDWFKNFRDKLQDLTKAIETKPLSEISKGIEDIIDEYLCVPLCSHPAMESCSKAFPDACWIMMIRDGINWHLKNGRLNLAKKHMENMLSPRFQEMVKEKFQRFMRRVTFSREVASREGIELITFGSKLLESAIKECKKEGFVARKLIDLSKHRLRGFERYEGMEGILFNFRVSFEAIDKEEKIIPIVMEPETNRYVEELSDEINNLSSTNLEECDISADEIKLAYGIALETLQKKIEARQRDIQDKVEDEYNKRLEKIDSYYWDIRESMMMKEEKAQNKVKTLLSKMRRARDVETRMEYRKQLEDAERKLSRVRNENNKNREKLMKNRRMELDRLDKQRKIRTSVELINAALIKVKA